MDVGRDFIGILAHALAGGILGHGLGDQPFELAERAIAGERLAVLLGDAFASVAMAASTGLAVDPLACRRFGTGSQARAGEPEQCG